MKIPMTMNAWRLGLYTFLLLLLAPVTVLLLWSFARSWPYPELLPLSYGLRAIRHFLSTETGVVTILHESIGLSLVVMCITLAISLPAGKAIGCYDFPGKRGIYLFLLSPLIVPPITVAMGIHVTFLRLGLANSYWGVVLIHLILGIPYAVRIIGNAYELTGDRMEVQARLLGASTFQTYRHVTIPLLTPALLSAGSMVFIVSFSQYFLTFLIGGGRVITYAMVMFPYIESGDRMMASVYSLGFILITLMVLAVVEGLLKRVYQHTGSIAP
jgi:putative spermidine/putrescine transport system permease protein